MADIMFSVDGIKLTAPSDPPTSLRVDSHPRPYRINAREVDYLHGTLVLMDNNVDLRFTNYLGRKYLDAIESEKTMISVLAVCDWLSANNADSSSMLYIVGGGTMQDIGASAAHLYHRGIPWTFIPTTLLSMADSCVGGKTGINHGGIKHLLGTFSPPREVLIDIRYLLTLTEEAITSGLGEIFRTYITGNQLQYFVSSPSTTDIIFRSLAIKRAVVEYDEFELSIRKSMNYGHTIGHALEAATNFTVPHGIAVAMGCLVENEIAVDLINFPESEANQCVQVAKTFFPPFCFGVFDQATELQRYISKDRKVTGSTVSLPLLAHIGETVFYDYPLSNYVWGYVQAAKDRFNYPKA